MKLSGVYKIENILSGKLYIGSSSRIKNRISEHRSELRKNKHYSKHLQSSFNKNGEESFIFEVLEFCEESSLLDIEQFYIDKYSSFLPDKGYNTCRIAGRTIGYRFTKEQKLNLSVIKKGKSFHTEYQLMILSKTHKNKVVAQSTLDKIRKPVVKVDPKTNEIIENYNSIMEASKLTGINNIVSVLKGYQLTSGGFKWKYRDETSEDRLSFNNRREKVNLNKKKGREKASITMSKPIIQIDKLTKIIIGEYSSAREAAKIFGFKNKGSITDVCRGAQKTAYGFMWEYKLINN